MVAIKFSARTRGKLTFPPSLEKICHNTYRCRYLAVCRPHQYHTRVRTRGHYCILAQVTSSYIDRASNECARRLQFYNHGEGPYYPLLLVESTY